MVAVGTSRASRNTNDHGASRPLSPIVESSRAGGSRTEGKSMLRRNGDSAAVVEAIHQPGGADEDWGRAVVEATSAILEGVLAIGLVVLHHSPDCTTAEERLSVVPDAYEPFCRTDESRLAGLGMNGFKSYLYPPYPVGTCLEVERELDPAMVTMPRRFRKQFGIGDILAIHAYPEPGTVMVMNALTERPIALSRHARERLARIGLHLGTSYRLRRRPEIVKAELDMHGRVLHRTDDAPPSRLLSAHAERVERARDRRGTDPGSAVDLWPALVAGHLSLVERGSGRSRRYLVVENGTNAQATRALTSTEIDVLAHASRGLTTKLISYALGISPSVVSARMASAASKIGASSRLDLVRLAAMVTRDPRTTPTGTTTLTAAERDVLELLQHGLSNAQIAQIRSRSVRTIANQVASLLSKTNSHTRRALLASDDDRGQVQIASN